MVRTTIACAWCRKSKIKCIHSGEPPCRNCAKSSRTQPEDCVLTGPFDRVNPPLDQQTQRRRNRPSRSQALSRSDGDSLRHPLKARSTGSSPAANHHSPSTPTFAARQQHHQGRLLGLQTSTLVQAAAVFTRKFPELAFLHLPSFSGSWETENGEKHWVHIVAMLALCHKFLHKTLPGLLSAEEYALLARKGLSSIATEPPNRSAVQALLTMSMNEWGSGNGYSAWMYSGMATRMMQSLQVTSFGREQSEKEAEIQNRTFWACFIMDRLIFCGRSQPLALPLEKMSIHLPIGEQDFAFDQPNVSHMTYQELDKLISTSDFEGCDTIDNFYSVLVRGFDIWAKILDFVISGGRRQPGMAMQENCPWIAGSPWKTIHDKLAVWRSHQSKRLQYPASDVITHVFLGHGEPFAVINLLYYISILFLNREYVPFLPTPASEPQGPVDPPLLEGLAPPNWWSDRARDLFSAAACITEILQKLDDLDCELITPFAGFCAFSAATMNLYIAAFPRMNLGRSPSGEGMANMNIQYLEKFKLSWKMGDRWSETIKQTQTLYQRLNTDRTRFQGKTRADFVALEASIHDYSGVSPPQDELPPEYSGTSHEGNSVPSGHGRTNAEGHENTAPVRAYQEHESMISAPFHSDVYAQLAAYGTWNDASPMWGDQQFTSFMTTGGIGYDFDVDLPLL